MSIGLIDSSFINNAIFSYGAQITTAILAFFSITIITRYGGLTLYGEVVMLGAMAGIATNVVTFRTNESVTYFFKKGLLGKNYSLCKEILVVGSVLDIVVASILLLTFTIISQQLSAFVFESADYGYLVTLFSYIGVLRLLRGTAQGYLVAIEKFKLLNLLGVIEQLIKAALLYLVLRNEIVPNLYVVGHVYVFASIVVTVALIAIAFVSYCRTGADPLCEYSNTKDILFYSINTFTSALLKSGSRNFEPIIVGVILSPLYAGLIDLFRQFLKPLLMITKPLTFQIYPKFTQAVVQHDIKGVEATIELSTRILSVVFVLATALVFPPVIIYTQWQGISMGIEHYLAFILVAASVIVTQLLWWSRPLSLSVNPSFSIRAAIISLGAFFAIVPGLTLLFGIIGMGLGVFAVSICLGFYWLTIFRSYVQNN